MLVSHISAFMLTLMNFCVALVGEKKKRKWASAESIITLYITDMGYKIGIASSRYIVLTFW